MIGEPASTQADLHFRLFGFPVRVHPFFWIVVLVLGMGGLRSGEADPVRALLFVIVAFVSILVHELGHAFLQRHHSGHPWITLYGFGGLSSCNDCDRSPRSQILISFAGPCAGFLFAGVVLLAILLTGRSIVSDAPGVSGVLLILPGKMLRVGPLFPSWQLNLIIFYVFWVNIWWGLINLLPVYPLDGGQIARELFTLADARQGIVRSLWLSIITAGAAALFALTRQMYFMAFLFGYLAYVNYQTLEAYRGRWRGGGW